MRKDQLLTPASNDTLYIKGCEWAFGIIGRVGIAIFLLSNCILISEWNAYTYTG